MIKDSDLVMTEVAVTRAMHQHSGAGAMLSWKQRSVVERYKMASVPLHKHLLNP